VPATCPCSSFFFFLHFCFSIYNQPGCSSQVIGIDGRMYDRCYGDGQSSLMYSWPNFYYFGPSQVCNGAPDQTLDLAALGCSFDEDADNSAAYREYVKYCFHPQVHDTVTPTKKPTPKPHKPTNRPSPKPKKPTAKPTVQPHKKSPTRRPTKRPTKKPHKIHN
jgi:hypothetical protein